MFADTNAHARHGIKFKGGVERPAGMANTVPLFYYTVGVKIKFPFRLRCTGNGQKTVK